MEDSEKICCVCLGSDLKLNNLSMKDENELTLHSKLTICVSEIVRLCSHINRIFNYNFLIIIGMVGIIPNMRGMYGTPRYILLIPENLSQI